MKSIIFHHQNYNNYGGVETFCFNTIKALSPHYKITFISKSFTASDLSELKKYCEIETYNPGKTYETDYCILATARSITPTNIKASKTIQIVHADYKAYIEGWNFKYKKNPTTTHHVCVSNHVKNMFEETTGFKCDKVIYNLL